VGAGNGFLGVVDLDGFTTIDFGTETPTTFGEFFQLDNVQTATAVPAILLLHHIDVVP
jgi:hypothetical protein